LVSERSVVVHQGQEELVRDVLERFIGGRGAFGDHRSILALQPSARCSPRWVGGVVDRIGAKLITVIGVIVCTVATVPFAVVTAHPSYLLLGAALIIRGGALSTVNIAISTGASRDCPGSRYRPDGIVRTRPAARWFGWPALLATVVAASP
jgi:hypothetical protein